MAQDIKAQARYIPISAQKIRLVLDLIRGKDLDEALNTLKFLTTQSALPITKVVSSAMANAEENFGVSRDDLFIYQTFADVAPTRKWRRFGARGRFKPWLRRAAHITVILREREDTQ